MSRSSPRAFLAFAVAIGLALAAVPDARSQQQQPQLPPTTGVKFQVRGPAERLEMTVNTSRVVEFPFDVPRMLVNNDQLVRVVPISSKSIQLSALKAGVTQLNVWDTSDNVTTIDLIILGDVAELDMTLKALFPQAALHLRPLNSSLYVSGFVPKAEMVSSITRVAQDYFPNIINDMSVAGVHEILLHVKVMEISRTKLRTLGFDWAQISSGGSFISQGVSGILQAPPAFPPGGQVSPLVGTNGAVARFGVIGSGGAFFGFVEALRENDLARLLAEPTLVTSDGRPASFNVGGQVPIPLQQALGVTTVTYRQFGTQIEFVPIVLGNGRIRLEVRPDITEIDPSLRDPVTGVPGFRQRMADTGVEIQAGQTLAIAGLVFTREDSVTRGIPWLADLPWVGVPFRRVSNKRNDVELLIFVTPEFCESMDPSEVPPCGPGMLTTTPTDVELYGRGYIEVPKNCPGGNCGPDAASGLAPGGAGYEELPLGPGAKPLPGSGAQTLAPRSGPFAKSIMSGTTGSGRTIGSGTVARPASMSMPSANQASSAPQRPAGSLQPAMIGSAGYDELK